MGSVSSLPPTPFSVEVFDGDATGAVVRQIDRMILEGTLPPGAKLREISLTDRLGVGRGPLREAIRVLEGRGLLTRTPNAGVCVINPTLEDFEQMLIAREALEGMAARQAAQNMTSGDIDNLRRLADEFIQNARSCEHDLIRAFEVGPDHDFHRSIALGCRNATLSRLLCSELYPILRLSRFRAAKLAPDHSTAYAEHLAIIEQIHRRDADGAETIMRSHVKRSRERLLGRLRVGGGDVREASDRDGGELVCA